MKPGRFFSLVVLLVTLAGSALPAAYWQVATVRAANSESVIVHDDDGAARTSANTLAVLDQVTPTNSAGPTSTATPLPVPTETPTTSPPTLTPTVPLLPTNTPAALVVGTILPDTVVNSVDNTLLIEGAGYMAPVQVEIMGSGYGLLGATIGGSGISLVLPAHFPAGTYNVVVHNGDGTAATATNTLTVLSPTPTPPVPATAASTPTRTRAPTGTPEPTTYLRPRLTVRSYGASSTVLLAGQDIDFEMTLENTGATTARNIIVTFVPGELIPRVTGGVIAIRDLVPGDAERFWQPLTVKSGLATGVAILNVQVEYTDERGTKYTGSFDLSFRVKSSGASATTTPTPTPTPTPTLNVRPQIIVESYSVDPNPPYPGAEVQLQLELVNASDELARQVITSLEFSADNLAVLVPLSSNRRFTELLNPGERAALSYELAVAGDASAGLVPISVQVSYSDSHNNTYQDTNTIGLRVEVRPAFLVTLYQAVPNTIRVGDTFELPVRVTNIGQNDVNVSTIEITSDHFTVTNGFLYLGPLYASASGSLLAQVGALEAGPATVTVTVNYLDDYQSPQKYTYEFTFEVQESRGAVNSSGNMPSETPGAQGIRAQATMTVGQRILQAILGFFGLATRTTGRAGGSFPQRTLP